MHSFADLFYLSCVAFDAHFSFLIMFYSPPHWTVTNLFCVVKVKLDIRGCLALATVVTVYSGDSVPLISIGQFSRTGSLEEAVFCNTPTTVEALCSHELRPDPGQLVK